MQIKDMGKEIEPQIVTCELFKILLKINTNM